MEKQDEKCPEGQHRNEEGKCVPNVEKQDEETLEQCMARVKEENPEMTDEQARGQCTAKPAPEAEKGLRNQILAVMKEYGDTLAEQIKKDIATKMDTVVKETRDEMVNSLRKGLGLEHDPVVHLSEVEGMVRKIVLDEKPHGKRTETVTKDKPTEGEGKSPIKSSKEIYDELRKDRPVI